MFELIKSFDSIKLWFPPRREPTVMQSFTANEAKTRFGELLDTAQREPVRVLRHGRVVGVMVSASDYDAMRIFFADRLRGELRSSADAAAESGMTPERLNELLADES